MLYICKYARSLCSIVVNLIADSNYSDEDPKEFLKYMSHYPAGTSIKALSHYAMIIQAGKFIYYDYGAEENMKRYGQRTPPEYKLQNIKDIPICLLDGKHDKLADPDDVKQLRDIFAENKVLRFYKEYDNLGHLTYFIPKEVDFLNDIFNCVDSFNN